MASGLSKRRASFTLVLLGLWLLLSQSLNPWHVGIGLVSAVAVVWLNTEPRATSEHRASITHVLTYVPWLLVRILAGGLHLSYLILHPKLPIKPRLFRYRTKLKHDTGVVLLSNSITLTPGTITVEAGDDGLVVHAMDAESARDLTSDRLEHRIAALFGLGDEHR